MNVTFATATYRDLRVIETVQSLRLHHGVDGEQIVVVDNAPDSPESEKIRDFCRKAGVRYVAFADAIGTSPARNKAIAEATTEWVLCFDCHVLFPPGLCDDLRRIMDYAGDNMILFHAVKMYDDLQSNPATHFEPVFRYGMLGIWRYDPRAETGEPFDIPASGLGAFLVRKADFFAAGGFHPGARGFGGEEVCFHEAFRRAGGRVMCHPALRYWHNFHQLERPYPLYLRDKVRNYLLWFKLLNWDTERVRRHFVRGFTVPEVASDGEVCDVSPHLMTEQEYLAILQNLDQPYSGPLAMGQSPEQSERRAQGCGACQERNRTELEHISRKLTELGISENRLAIVTLDRRWTTYYPNALFVTVNQNLQAANVIVQPLNKLPRVENRDVLIWDPPRPMCMMFEVIREQLYNWPTIVVANLGVTDTITIDVVDPIARTRTKREERSVLSCLREWLSSTGSQYGVISLVNEGNRFVIISRDPAYTDKQLPSWFQRLRGFTAAAIEHLASGASVVPDDVFEKRRGICALCEWRTGNVCSKCGCPIDRKARWSSSRCPIGRW